MNCLHCSAPCKCSGCYSSRLAIIITSCKTPALTHWQRFEQPCGMEVLFITAIAAARPATAPLLTACSSRMHSLQGAGEGVGYRCTMCFHVITCRDRLLLYVSSARGVHAAAEGCRDCRTCFAWHADSRVSAAAVPAASNLLTVQLCPLI